MFVFFPTLGELIAHEREAKGMTRNALAEACNISRTEIIRMEENKRKQPSMNNLKKISEVLSIPLDVLMSTAGYIPKEDESSLKFYYPAIKTDKQLETIEKIIACITENPDLPDDALDSIVKQAELLILANKHR